MNHLKILDKNRGSIGRIRGYPIRESQVIITSFRTVCQKLSYCAYDNKICESFHSKKESSPAPSESSTRSDFIDDYYNVIRLDGLKKFISDNDLIEYFKNYGKVLNVEQLFNKIGTKIGQGYVEFKDCISVHRLRILNQRDFSIRGSLVQITEFKTVCHKLSYCQYESEICDGLATSKNSTRLDLENDDSNGIRLEGLKKCISDHDLREYFETFGNVLNVEQLRNKDGQRVGQGYVEFKDCHPVNWIRNRGYSEFSITGSQVKIKWLKTVCQILLYCQYDNKMCEFFKPKSESRPEPSKDSMRQQRWRETKHL